MAGHLEVRPLFFSPHIFGSLPGLGELLGEESSAPQKMDSGRPPWHCGTSNKYEKYKFNRNFCLTP